MIDKKNWSRVRFGDVVKQIKDKVDPRAAGIKRYVAGEHMKTDDLRIRTWGEVTDDYLGPAFHMRFKPGQVLYGSRRTYLRKVAVPDFEGVCANTTFVLEAKDPKALLPELLPFIMQTESFVQHSIKQSKGSVNPYVNFTDLAWYEFALPPLAEQRRIAEVLQSMLKTIEAIQTALENLSIMKNSLIQERSEKFGRSGFVEFQSIVNRIESGKSPSARPEPAKEGEYGVLKVSAVSDWRFISVENKSIDVSDYMSQFEVKKGDFLATRANADPHSVGRTCIVTETPVGLMLSDKTWRIVFKMNNPYSEIGILAWTKSPPFRSHILKHLSGTDAKNISQSKFLKGPFPACSPEEFNSFANEVITLLSSETAFGMRKIRLRKLFKRYLDEVIGT